MHSRNGGADKIVDIDTPEIVKVPYDWPPPLEGPGFIPKGWKWRWKDPKCTSHLDGCEGCWEDNTSPHGDPCATGVDEYSRKICDENGENCGRYIVKCIDPGMNYGCRAFINGQWVDLCGFPHLYICGEGEDPYDLSGNQVDV